MEVNMYKCPFCGAEFLRKEDYNTHVRECPYQYGKPEPKVEEFKEIKERPKKKKEK
jgi:uncharacterized C2H2 Zn-finger protein